jgi:hypothetical protein
MTQEDKELLLKDLCSRLPYGVKVLYEEEIYQISIVEIFNETITICGRGYPMEVEIQKVKPYLFPLESMTEEQKEEYYGTFSLSGDISGSVDFYNKHHLDWRGLIQIDLAIDATGLNIY